MLGQRLMSRAFQRGLPSFRYAHGRSIIQRRPASGGGKLELPDNEFNRERTAVKAHAAATSGINAYNLWVEHWEHWDHMPPLEERVEYPYQNIRSKNFPWGDGDKSAFWNNEVNYHNKDKVT